MLRAEGVAAIYLVHGSFDGAATLGVLAELARTFPGANPAFRRVIQRFMEKPCHEDTHYSERYARAFEAAINRLGQTHIPVRLFHWSGENHHLGRADGAVRLIDELASLDLTPGQRVLLWGHNHAGNLFALMTNLLGGSRVAVERFFKAAAIYYQWPLLGLVDIPVWNRVYRLLQDRAALDGVGLDMVTFGTPIRYGWDSGGYSRLLHFIHHRPVEGLPIYRGPWPLELDDVMKATHGDYVQQLGIAGTDTVPSLFAWRVRLANQRLERLLEADAAQADPIERFCAGAIVPNEGTTLLVDYGEPEGSIAEHQAGHAVYTQRSWLLFHAEEVAHRFYAARAYKVA